MAVPGLGVDAEFVAEVEPGPGGGFGLVLEPECVAFVGLVHRAEPGSVHRFGLVAGAEAERGFGFAAETASASQW